jgi:hypothetical protein
VLFPSAKPLLFRLRKARKEVRGEGFHALIADGVAERDYEEVCAHREALDGIEVAAESAVGFGDGVAWHRTSPSDRRPDLAQQGLIDKADVAGLEVEVFKIAQTPAAPRRYDKGVGWLVGGRLGVAHAERA